MSEVINVLVGFARLSALSLCLFLSMYLYPSVSLSLLSIAPKPKTGDRLTEIHLIEIVIFQLIESFNNELIHNF